MHSISTRLLKVNLEDSFFNNLRFDTDSLKLYRIEAATHTAEKLGDNPALCLSGGIDSQSMVYAWLEAGLKFDVVSCVFNNDLNKHDVDTAIEFCKIHDINLKLIPLNVTQFLNRENLDYAVKYKSSSPQFNVHYKFFNMLREIGYTGACCGGVALFRDEGNWGTNLKYNIFNFINYVQSSGFMVQGSFLSYYPKLAWSIGLLTREVDLPRTGVYSNDLFDLFEKERYKAKSEGYTKAGFKIIPQPAAFTGFEEVKRYYESITKDGWEFEKRFRHPIQNLHKVLKNKIDAVQLDLSENQLCQILSLYSNNMISC